MQCLLILQQTITKANQQNSARIFPFAITGFDVTRDNSALCYKECYQQEKVQSNRKSTYLLRENKLLEISLLVSFLQECSKSSS